MAVAYSLIDERIGNSSLSASDAAAALEVGYVGLAKDPTYGVGEFMYVKFTGTVAAGDFVVVDRFAVTCIQSPTSATKGNLGIAMAAQTTGKFGWVMIRGVHDGANVVTGVTAGTLLGGTATAGRANTTGTVANYTFDGALAKNTAASNVGTVEIYWPICSGR